MWQPPNIQIKVCCIANRDEAKLAVSAGATALGLVSKMPSGPGVIDESVIQDISRAVPPPIATFLLTSLQDADAIITQQQRCGTNTIQLTDSVKQQAYATLRAGLPGIKLVQVIHVVGEGSIEEAMRVSPHVDAILLDSGNPKLKVKELGGTGRRHDWSISKRLVEHVPIPVYLAGGLNAENVQEAIQTVRPYGLDICSGVRTDGKLDKNKLEAFFTAVRDKP